jgi:uncharacterized membrane protein YedE/YeeE
MKRRHARTVSGAPIRLPRKELGSGARYAIGGIIFGLGWAITGACPGPLFALVGAGASAFVVAVASALVGTWLYALMRHRLPH